MREIKFRAWDKENNKMLNPITQIWWFDRDGFETEHCLRLSWKVDKFGYWRDCIPDQIELMQYTGLKDKNGKEIYESDILKCKHAEQENQGEFYEEIKPVVFYKGGFEAMSKLNDWHIKDGNLSERRYVQMGSLVGSDHYYIQFDIEVIGNIHENPELL